MKLKIVAGVFALLVLFAGASAVTGATAGDREPEREVRLIDEEITVDGLITISDTTIRGPFGSDEHVDERRYTVDSTVRFDGFHVTHEDTRYTICRVVVHVDDVGILVENVTLEATN